MAISGINTRVDDLVAQVFTLKSSPVEPPPANPFMQLIRDEDVEISVFDYDDFNLNEMKEHTSVCICAEEIESNLMPSLYANIRGFQSCHYWHHSSLHFCAHLTNFHVKFWWMNERMRNLMSDKWLTLKPPSSENVNNGPIRGLGLSAWCWHFHHIWVWPTSSGTQPQNWSHDTLSTVCQHIHIFTPSHIAGLALMYYI